MHNPGENQPPPSPQGPDVPRAQLLRLAALWRQDAGELIAAAAPAEGKRGRPVSTERGRVQELTAMLADTDARRERAENLARARAMLTAQRELLDLMR